MHYLTLTWGGRVFRFAEVATAVATDAGGILAFEEGLEAPDIEYTATIGGLSEMSEASVVIVSDSIDVPALLTEGLSLAVAVAELSYLERGTWESREVRLSARIDAPEYDVRGAPLAFGLRMDRAASRPLFPPVSAFFVKSGEEIIAPLVFGSPSVSNFYFGSRTGTVFDKFAGSPAAILDGDALIAYHPVHADETTLVSDHASPFDRIEGGVDYPIVFDGFSVMEGVIPWGGTVPRAAGVEWYYGRYGMFRPTVANEPVKTLGHLIEALLIMAGDCDEGRTAAAVPLLPFEVDGYIEARVDLVEWIVSNVCSIFPVGLVRGPRGLYPIVLQAWLRPDQVVATFTAGINCDREGGVVYESTDDLKNDIQVLYGMDAISREFLAQHLHTGDPEIVGTNGFTSSAIARASRSDFGEHAEFLESRIIFRPATAAAVAAWRVRRYAYPTRELVYRIDRSERVEVGEGVRMVDDEMTIDHVCVVERRRDFPTHSLITVRTMEQP